MRSATLQIDPASFRVPSTLYPGAGYIREHVVSFLVATKLLLMNSLVAPCHDSLILVNNHLSPLPHLPLLCSLLLQAEYFTICINLLVQSLLAFFIVKCLYFPINIKLRFFMFLFDGFLMVYEMYACVTKYSIRVHLHGM